MSFKFNMQGERLWKYRAALSGRVTRCSHNRNVRWQTQRTLAALPELWQQTEYKQRHDAFVSRVKARKAA